MSYIGKTFGDLTIKSVSKKRVGKRNKSIAYCECSCGASGYVALNNLKNGHSKSCTKFNNKSFSLNGITEVYFHTGEIMLIDTKDYLLFNSRRFTYCKSPGYVRFRIKEKQEYVHRFIAGLMFKDLKIVDHINRYRLDNRRLNLRNTTGSINSHNINVKKKNGSKYKGVFIRGEKFMSQISVKNKAVYIGLFSSEEEAAEKYDLKAIEIHGDSATTNKSLGLL